MPKPSLRELLRFSENALATILDWFDRPPTTEQAALAQRLTDDLNELRLAHRTGDGSDFWQGVCGDLHRLAAANDPRYFMRWPPIAATMVHGAVAETVRTWWALRHTPEWSRIWRPALRHPRFGHPPPFAPMPSTNAMAIEHASHLYRFQRAAGTSLLDSDCIIEFGGGFGSMCRLVRALGFQGRYIIFDLPPIAALQRYYLGLHGIGAGASGAEPVWLCDDLDRILESIGSREAGKVSLISTWALSEMPMTVRDRIEIFFGQEVCAKALLAYQPTFEGIDNDAWFSGLMARTGARWSWQRVPVQVSEAPPSPGGSQYLFGTTR